MFRKQAGYPSRAVIWIWRARVAKLGITTVLASQLELCASSPTLAAASVSSSVLSVLFVRPTRASWQNVRLELQATRSAQHVAELQTENRRRRRAEFAADSSCELCESCVRAQLRSSQRFRCHCKQSQHN